MSYFSKDQRVEHVQTGSEGTVTSTNGDTVEVSWDPNEHGGYISEHQEREIAPVRR